MSGYLHSQNRKKAFGSKADPGLRGIIETIPQYEHVKKGDIDWKDYVKENLKTVEIPVELFFKLMEQDKMYDSEMTKCSFQDGVTVKPDGEHELDACCYKVKEIHRNVTVTVSECKRCGAVDISWERQDDTEDEIVE